MKKSSLFQTAALLALAAGAARGSSITGVSTDTSQTNYTVSYSTFTVVGGTPGGGQAGMGGLVITATFADGAQSCTWVNATGCAGTGFTVTFPSGTQTDPDAGGSGATWTITNTRAAGAGNQITSIFFNAVTGLLAFDRCMTGAGTFSDATNSSGNCSTGSGGIEGTTGSNTGWSAATATGGTAGISAAALYANELKISSQAVQGDAWGSLKLTFGGTTSFVNGDTFTFQADTDKLASAGGTVPEPATFGLVGLALVGLGVLRSRKIRS
jgi:hypothetical protein